VAAKISYISQVASGLSRIL